MKPYLITTGLLFGAIAVTHTYLALTRDHLHVHEILLVIVTAGLTAWAARLLRAAAA